MPVGAWPISAVLRESTSTRFGRTTRLFVAFMPWPRPVPRTKHDKVFLHRPWLIRLRIHRFPAEVINNNI